MAQLNSYGSEPVVRSNSPFSGLVICVTGLSKEARKQVKEATERLGGRYSPDLHPQCTHLVVQYFNGRKFEHALKHRSKLNLFVVTLGWFVDSVKRNGKGWIMFADAAATSRRYTYVFLRLSESPYSLKGVGDDLAPLGENHAGINGSESMLLGGSIYIDSEISDQLRNKVHEVAKREGAVVLDKWFVGCGASYVVCDESSFQRYLGYCSNIVTPLWMLKTAKENRMQRLIHISPDLARQVGLVLENFQKGDTEKRVAPQNTLSKVSQEERLQIVDHAKNGVRKRRGRRMQICKTPISPITPISLLGSVCWCISEPTSTASTYADSASGEDGCDHRTLVFYDRNGDDRELEASFTNQTRPLTETEKTELILKNHFLTILFPVDRFSEMGPSSRTFFSQNGFTCLQVLDLIYSFYQENMSTSDIEAAIHTDSRHADLLRTVYSSKETAESSRLVFKRIDFLGSRVSFEMLKRVNGNNNGNVYELLLRA